MVVTPDVPEPPFLGPFRYRFLAPPALAIIGGPDGKTYGDVVRELEGVVNMVAAQGWEFVGVEHITVVPRKGIEGLLEPDYENRLECPFVVMRQPSASSESAAGNSSRD